VIRNIHEFFHFENNLDKETLICLNNQSIDVMKNIDRLSKDFSKVSVLRWSARHLNVVQLSKAHLKFESLVLD